LPIIKNSKVFNEDFYEFNNDPNIQQPKMTHDDHKFIARHMSFREVKAGENVINFGELGREFFIILKGKC